MTIKEQITAKRTEVDDRRLSFRLAEDELAELVRREKMEKSPFRTWLEEEDSIHLSNCCGLRQQGWNACMDYIKSRCLDRSCGGNLPVFWTALVEIFNEARET